MCLGSRLIRPNPHISHWFGLTKHGFTNRNKRKKSAFYHPKPAQETLVVCQRSNFTVIICSWFWNACIFIFQFIQHEPLEFRFQVSVRAITTIISAAVSTVFASNKSESFSFDSLQNGSSKTPMAAYWRNWVQAMLNPSICSWCLPVFSPRYTINSCGG